MIATSFWLKNPERSEEIASVMIDTEMSETETAIEELIEEEDAAESTDGDGTRRQREIKEKLRQGEC